MTCLALGLIIKNQSDWLPYCFHKNAYTTVQATVVNIDKTLHGIGNHVHTESQTEIEFVEKNKKWKCRLTTSKEDEIGTNLYIGFSETEDVVRLKPILPIFSSYSIIYLSMGVFLIIYGILCLKGQIVIREKTKKEIQNAEMSQKVVLCSGCFTLVIIVIMLIIYL